MNPEIIAAFIAVAASLMAAIIALLVRIEHRLTVIEVQLEGVVSRYAAGPPARIVAARECSPQS